MRRPAQFTDSWGEPMAVMHVVLAMHGAAQVRATKLLRFRGTKHGMHAAVEVQASWEFHVPPPLQGILQLHTTARVNGHSAFYCSYKPWTTESQTVVPGVHKHRLQHWCLACTERSACVGASHVQLLFA